MSISANATTCRRTFLRHFPGGFRDDTYLEWERDYKWASHRRWMAALGREEFVRLLGAKAYREIAARALRVEQQSRHSMIFSFEKMAVRDAVKSEAGAAAFARGLFAFLHVPGTAREKFTAWVDAVSTLPRKQTRVLTWPVVSVFGFIAKPRVHIFLKPVVTRRAAAAYGFDLVYASRPNWPTYRSLLDFAATVRADIGDLRPRDFIDIQSFLWVLGSDEYSGTVSRAHWPNSAAHG